MEMGQVEGVNNLYLFALAFVSISIYLYAIYLKKHSWRNKFFWLPFLHLVTATLFVVITLNIAMLPVTDPDILLGLGVTLYVLDAISTVSLGFAFFFRLRLLIITAVGTHRMSRWVQYACWVFIIPGLVFPISSIVGIVCLFDDGLAAQGGGKFCQYLTNSFNIFFNVNEVIMNSFFSYELIKQTEMAPRKVKITWGVSSALLTLIPIACVAGAIVSFFDPYIGTAISYTFWLIDNSAYLLMNRLLAKGFKKFGPARVKNS